MSDAAPKDIPNIQRLLSDLLLRARRNTGFMITFSIAFILIIGSEFVFKRDLYSLYDDASRSIAYGLIAAAMTTITYEIVSADALRKAMADLAAEEAVKYGRSTYDKIQTDISRIFRDYIPKRVFENNRPDKQYNDVFDSLLSASSQYKYRGDTANLTTFQIDTIWPRLRAMPHTFSFMLLNPSRDENFRRRAAIDLQMTRRSSDDTFSVDHTDAFDTEIDAKAAVMRKEVYISVFALWDHAYRNRERHRTYLSFYDDIPFYRSEIIDGGAFIQFYINGDFEGTFFYERDSFICRAFNDAFELGMRNNYDLSRLSQSDFITLINTLGFDTENKTNSDIIKELITLRDKRYASIMSEYPELAGRSAKQK